MNQPLTNICPLMALAPIGTTNGPAVCIEERCAWYFGDSCAVLSLASSLDSMSIDGIATHPEN